MNRLAIQNSMRFVGFSLIQILLLNNLDLHGWLDPQFYILFILLLPIRIPSWFVMILSLLMGLLIGAFFNSSGMHAAALVFLGFSRPLLLNILTPRNGYDEVVTPSLRSISNLWFLSYITIACLVHHLVLFSIEIGSFQFLGLILAKTFFSLLLTIFTILVYAFVFTSTTKR